MQRPNRKMISDLGLYLWSMNVELKAKQRKARLIKHAKRHSLRDPKLAVLLKKIGIR